MPIFRFVLLIFLATGMSIQAQTKKVKGPVIEDFGPTYPVNSPDIEVDISATYKLILDVASSSDDKSVVNKSIVTAARFLNMHANAGVPVDQLAVSVVIHGQAWQDVMTNDAYKEKFGVDNPNIALIEAIKNVGGEVILCGQTAGKRGLDKTNVNPDVRFALSAMTTFLQYQNYGFTYLKL